MGLVATLRSLWYTAYTAPNTARLLRGDLTWSSSFAGDLAVTGDLLVSGSLVLPKTSGEGLLVDIASPGYGWRDLLGKLDDRGGGTAPTWAVLRGTVRGWSFPTTNGTKELYIELHVPHDYAPGTDLYIHTHWAQATVDTGGPAGVPGTVEWRYDISYADGHGTPGGAADPFVAPITATVNQQGSTTQYGHMIAEVAITSAGGSGNTLDRATIAVDGVFLVRMYRDAVWASDTLNQSPYAFFVDLHYQSTSTGTKQKTPNFYT